MQVFTKQKPFGGRTSKSSFFILDVKHLISLSPARSAAYHPQYPHTIPLAAAVSKFYHITQKLESCKLELPVGQIPVSVLYITAPQLVKFTLNGIFGKAGTFFL